MKKKLVAFTLSIVFCFSSLLFSQEKQDQKETMKSRQGFYWGMNPGYRTLIIKNDHSGSIVDTSNGVTSSLTWENEKNNGGSGFVGRIDFGYGFDYQSRFYLALNAFADLSNASMKNDRNSVRDNQPWNDSNELKHRGDIGLGIRSGVFVFSKGLIYLDFSYINGSFKHEMNSLWTHEDGSTFFYSSTKSKKLSGFEVGLGSKFDLSDGKERLFLGLNANYHIFEKWKHENQYTGTRDNKTITTSDAHNIKLSGLDASFSISYLF